MKKMSVLDWCAWVLVIIGALNWGLVGFFSYDLIATIFGSMSVISRVIYALIGLGGLYAIYMCVKCCKACRKSEE